MNNLKFIFRLLLHYFRLLLQIVKILLNFIPKVFKIISCKINKGLRFSISFKMTAVYTLIFSIILFLLSLGLIIGFRVFILNEVQSELTKYNSVAVNYVKLDNDFQSFNVNIFSNLEYVTLNIFDEDETLLYSTQ